VVAAFLLAAILAITSGAIITSLQSQGQPQYQSALGPPVFVPSPTPPKLVLPPGSTFAPIPPLPISGPPSKAAPPRLPDDQAIVYNDDTGIYLLTTDDAEPEKLNTPGYDPLVPPLLTGDGRLLYTGDGVYLLDLLQPAEAMPLQITSIDPKTQVIASATISPDGQEVFWSIEPHTGNGTTSLYEASLTDTGANQPNLLYSQQAGVCPCYTIFGLGPGISTGLPSLLLTDDLGTPAAQGTGLWSFDPAQLQIGPELLANDAGQAPLALSPDHTQMVYAPTTGEVPEPTDSSVPAQIANQPYGNSISITSWNGNSLGTQITVVPQQTNVHTFSEYHWITTPVFSPDSQTLAYIQFSADDNGPYDRHNTLYITTAQGTTAPQVVANFSARLVELGSWLDNHTLILYADGGIYALDVRTAAIALLAPLANYSHIIGLMHRPQGTPVNTNTSQRQESALYSSAISHHAMPAQPLPHPLTALSPAAFQVRTDIRGSLHVRR
jgi:hypothetical protein